MSVVSHLALWASDDRKEYRDLAKQYIESSRSATLTVIFTMVVATIIIIIIVLTAPKRLVVIAAAKIIVAVIRNLINNDLLTILRVKVGSLAFALTMAYLLISDLIINNQREALTILVYSACRVEAEVTLEENCNQWIEFDAMLPRADKNDISLYWRDKGLNTKKIASETLGIRIKAQPPLKSTVKEDYCIDVREHVGFDHPLANMELSWVRSDMSDDMHVKSIYKRLCPKKSTINTKTLRQMREKMVRIVDHLNCNTSSKDSRLMRALNTKGTAGQFSKGSAYEQIWKTSLNLYATEMWMTISMCNIENVAKSGEVKQSIAGYMLYRKKEAINSTDNEPKPTRLMNAPNLICRLSDSITFTDFNDAVIEAREEIASSLGINVFVEMKLIHAYNRDFVYITSDYKDYDGTQHPYQGYAAALTRILYGIKNNMDPIELAYIIPKYKSHMYRHVESTWGISYDVVGQQASGDITTSDDNTLKTSAMCALYIDELAKQKQIILSKEYESEVDIYLEIKEGFIGMDVTSDDTGLMVQPSEKFDEKKVENIYTTLTKQVGWQIKEGSFDIKQMNQDPLEYLSHGVQDRSFRTRSKLTILTMRCIIRPNSRAWGKFMIAAELDNIMNNANKAKLASKYMTLAMVSLNNPAMMLVSLELLIKLRVTPTSHEGSYSWANIKAQSLRSLLLNNAIRLQSTINMTERFDWIEIKDEEMPLFKRFKDSFDKSVMSIEAIDARLKPPSSNYQSIMDGNWFNWREALMVTQSILRQCERHGVLALQTNITNDWWIDRLDIVNTQLINADDSNLTIKRETTSCEHIKYWHEATQNIKKSDTKFQVHFLCLKCYKQRKEKRYEKINISIDTSTKRKFKTVFDEDGNFYMVIDNDDQDIDRKASAEGSNQQQKVEVVIEEGMELKITSN